MANNKKKSQLIERPKSMSEYQSLHQRLTSGGFVAVNALKPGLVRSLTLGDADPSVNKSTDLAASIKSGAWSNGPLMNVAWSFDERDVNAVTPVNGADGKPMGPGYVKWGPGNCTPSTIPVLAQALPYTAAPLRYLADLTTGLGPCLMYAFPDGSLSELRYAGYKLLLEIEKRQNDTNDFVLLIGGDNDEGKGDKQSRFIGDYVRTEEGIMTIDEAKKLGLEPQGVSNIPKNLGPDYWRRLYAEWEKTWLGYEWTDNKGISHHAAGAKEFLEENNLNFHMSQCMQDDVMLDIYFPTIGFDNKGTAGEWRPTINRVGFLPSHSTRLGAMDENRYIHNVYFSDRWRTLGAGKTTDVSPGNNKTVMYRAAMPQDTLHELRYIVENGQKKRGERYMWVVCPTLYPSLNKPYYPQPAWWSIFTSKAFDFSSTILYDKAKQRENRTSWGRIIYISLDYLEQIFAGEGYVGNQDAQDKFVEDLENRMEEFLQRRENQGKFMRQWMWTDQKGDEHYNVKIVDIADAVNDVVKAGKEELELSTSPIFLALQVDPRLVGVPMVAASNGGTALREMALLKQQQLNTKQRLYEHFLNTVCIFNGWANAEFHIKQMVLSTLDRSKTGTVDVISGEGKS